MLNERAPQQPLLSDGQLPQRSGAKTNPKDMTPGNGAEVVTPIATWLSAALKEYAAAEMPEASWDDVLHAALATGLGALNGVVSARRPSDRTPLDLPGVQPHVTWQERLCRGLRAEIARIGAPLVVNAEDIARLAPDQCTDLTNRTIGFTFAAFSRSPQPAFGLRVENIGRGPGQPLHQYRLTAVDG